MLVENLPQLKNGLEALEWSTATIMIVPTPYIAKYLFVVSASVMPLGYNYVLRIAKPLDFLSSRALRSLQYDW